MSFELDIEPKESAAVDFMTMIHREIVRSALDARQESGMTQREAAELLDIDRATLSRLLKGGGNPTVRTVGELLWAFGVTSTQLETLRGARLSNVTTACDQPADVTILDFNSPQAGQTSTSGSSATPRLAQAQ